VFYPENTIQLFHEKLINFLTIGWQKKKFLFWITQEFEKDLKQKISIYFINSISAFSISDRTDIKKFAEAMHQISYNEQKKMTN